MPPRAATRPALFWQVYPDRTNGFYMPKADPHSCVISNHAQLNTVFD